MIREAAGRVVLVVASVVVSLVMLEIGCRLWLSPSYLRHWPNLVAEQVRGGNPQSWCAHVHDPLVGWTPSRNFSAPDYHTDSDGYRVTPPAEGPPVLATGSSFTEGQEVDDGEAWPARLQEMIARKVVNAGVEAYALDQSVLRTEQLAAVLKPAAIVLGFTPYDIGHMELRVVWNQPKPYFSLGEDGSLTLRNVPVPPGPADCTALPFWASAFGWSALMDVIAGRLGWQNGWLYEEVVAQPAGTAERLACPLMRRLARLGVPVLLVAHYNRLVWLETPSERQEDRRQVRMLLDCATQAGLATLDLFELIRREVAARGLDSLYRTDHHSPEGNRLVARAIADALRPLY